MPMNTPEGTGMVPALEKTMGMIKSQGLPMMQKVGKVLSSIDGHEINFILRRFGYDTTVVKSSLNIKTDIIDSSEEVFRGMTDGEVFLMAMQEKFKGGSTQNIFGKKSLLITENNE